MRSSGNSAEALLLALALALLAAGCATPLYQPEDNGKAPALTLLQARKTLLEVFSGHQLKLKLTTYHGRQEHPDIGVKEYGGDFRALPPVGVMKESAGLFTLNFPTWAPTLGHTNQTEALRLAKAINALIYYANNRRVSTVSPSIQVFMEQARTWRITSTKPSFPPELQRRRILAENAVRERDYEAALEHFAAALAEAPLWPEGHFNAASLYAEIEAYAHAADHLRRYLELVPAAPDAAAAREKLIVWEGMAK